MQQLVDREREHNQELENQVTQLSSEKQAFQKQLERAQQKLARVEVEHKQETVELKESNERRIEELLKQLKEKSSDLNSDLVEWKNKCAFYQSQISDKDKEKKELENDWNRKLEQIVQQKEQELKQHYEKKRKELQELETDRLQETYEKQITALKQSLAQKEAELQDVGQRYRDEIETTMQNASASIKEREDNLDQWKRVFKANMEQEFEKSREEEQTTLKEMFKQRLQQVQEENTENTVNAIKSIMSKIYFSVANRFNQEKRYRAEKILGLLITNIKKMTLALVEHVKQGNDIAEFEEEEEEEGLEEIEDDEQSQTEVNEEDEEKGEEEEEKGEAEEEKSEEKGEEEEEREEKGDNQHHEENSATQPQHASIPVAIVQEVAKPIEVVSETNQNSTALLVEVPAVTTAVKEPLEPVSMNGQDHESVEKVPDVPVATLKKSLDSSPAPSSSADEAEPHIEEEEEEARTEPSASSVAMVPQSSIAMAPQSDKHEPPVQLPDFDELQTGDGEGFSSLIKTPQLTPEEQQAAKEKEMAAKNAKRKALFFDDEML